MKVIASGGVFQDYPRPGGSEATFRVPGDRLWRRTHLFDCNMAILLWQDGTVLEVREAANYYPDAALQRGNTVEEGSWQETVLLDAGYVLEEYP